jgi:hypothetical protein
VGLQAKRIEFALAPNARKESAMVDVALRFNDVSAAKRQFRNFHGSSG